MNGWGTVDVSNPDVELAAGQIIKYKEPFFKRAPGIKKTVQIICLSFDLSTFYPVLLFELQN